MLDCLNKNCGDNYNGVCSSIDISKCKDIIIPTHTPSYAEEQLEHAEQQEIEKNKNFLKIDNDNLTKENKEMQKLLENQSISIKEYMKENESLKEENKKLTEELESLKYQFEGVQQIIKENERKLYNYESIKGLIKILYEGL